MIAITRGRRLAVRVAWGLIVGALAVLIGSAHAAAPAHAAPAAAPSALALGSPSALALGSPSALALGSPSALALGTPSALAPHAAPGDPTRPATPNQPAGSDLTVGIPGEPSRVVQIIVLITILGVAPSILLMCTAFTKIVVVLSLARNALGAPTVPPNQVLVGLALFLSLFVMGPTLDQMNSEGLQPYLKGTKTSAQAYTDGVKPLREFMLDHTRDEELALMTKAAGEELPDDRDSVGMRTLVPAFVLSELRAAFIIGFVIFVPFLVVDLVVSAILMSLGMVMLPPSLVSLPFKLLLFVLVDGWGLIVTTLIASYK